ncbi:hypothetical protein ACIP88_05045 [Streptomyces uncialis]|uniref:hypothetical protein n=1 Tax=Streptomyces uncialis TaxID=1048205 RepID=UPI00382AAA58
MSPKKDISVPTGADGLPTLELRDIEGESEGALQARGAAYAREYAKIEHKPTILLQNIATVVVALRKKHGDYAGQSHEYRQVVAEMYRQANIPPDSSGRIQSAVRYHIGNALRRYLTTRELKRLELLDSSPLERLQDRRATDSVILAATKASAALESSQPRKAPKATSKPAKGKATENTLVEETVGQPVKATADVIRLINVAENIASQVSTDVIDDHMTDGQRVKLEEHLAALQKHVTRLRRHAKKRTSDA